jgi:hypothetical protein
LQRKGFQPGFPRNLCLGAPFEFVWQVDIFQRHLGFSTKHCGFQFGRQLALFGDTAEDGRAPLFHFAQVAQTLLQIAQLGIIQAAGGFLAVA